jgi:hypothetical protein
MYEIIKCGILKLIREKVDVFDIDVIMGWMSNAAPVYCWNGWGWEKFDVRSIEVGRMVHYWNQLRSYM